MTVSSVDFEDTYDGLGDHLDEADDALNDETFGGGPSNAPTASQKAVGRDFDFFGQTAKVSDAMSEEHMRFARQQPPPKMVAPQPSQQPKQTPKPKRSGYERYQEAGDIANLQVNPSLWGVAPKQTISHDRQQSSGGPPMGKKFLSLEEVEAGLQSQAKKPARPQVQAQINPRPQSQASYGMPPQIFHPPQGHRGQAHMFTQDPSFTQGTPIQKLQQPYPTSNQLPPQMLQQNSHIAMQPPMTNSSPQPIHLLQQLRGTPQPTPPPLDVMVAQFNIAQDQGMGGAHSNMRLVTHPEQLLQMSEEQRTAYLMDDAKRAKRNHKIHLLSKDNGLMTPQDKHFISRIQLQQLVTATGNPNERGADAGLEEDFYYQVHSQIRGGPRQTPNQPLSNFAQTYLFQTGSRQGFGARRHHRNAENHMQRMEQQVQRAVEAAKLKPKNRQLVIEGSLGKISFSNAKTPKPLLNIRRPEPAQDGGRPLSTNLEDKMHRTVPTDRNRMLKNLEHSYQILMQMEDLERHGTQVTAESGPEEIEYHAKWAASMSNLNAKLWNKLEVMAPIDPSSPIVHPFIAFLSFPKGKKAVPRIFRHINEKQRLFVVTVIFVHLGHINAVKLAQILPDNNQLPLVIREEVELFAQAVIPCIYGYINEAPLNIVSGLFGLLMNNVNVQALVLTKIGVMIITTLASRAELLKEAGEAPDEEWEQWLVMYNRFFDVLEPVLAHLFPGSVHSGEDVYLWQFLAAIAIGGSPEQQQRLVLGVRDRVLGTVQQAKTLPPDASAQRISHVNLFMRALGLDVDKLG
ncbi:MAG: Protein PAT1 1 [Vezdaea aestivalis]|nr:MAG: Protein PAT1 1 [Vezdaea aestivalis]